jgi:hypothetical protein
VAIGVDCLPDPIDRCLVLALLKLRDSEQMQCIEMAGHLRKYFAVEVLGLRELPALVMSDRLLEPGRDSSREWRLTGSPMRRISGHVCSENSRRRRGLGGAPVDPVNLRDRSDPNVGKSALVQNRGAETFRL